MGNNFIIWRNFKLFGWIS